MPGNSWSRPFVLRISRRAALLVLALPALFCVLAPGCSQPKPQKPKAPDPYVIRGRVVDAESGQPIPQARVRLLANLQTILGPRSVSALDTTAVNGTYQITLGGGLPVIRSAQQIRIDAGAEGYGVGGVEIPVPKEKQDVCSAPDIRLVKTALKSRPVRAAPVRKPAPGASDPLPWKE